MALPKLFERIFWHNNTTPAINEDNLNAMSKAIDDIDDRVIAMGDDVIEVVPQIQAYLEQAEDLVEAMEQLSQNPPYIGANGDWYVWNTATSEFVDSGVDASITVNVADITMLPVGSTPYVTNTGTSTDPVFHLFIPSAPQGAQGVGIANIQKTDTIGNVDVYTITLTDGSTYTFNVTNGTGAGDMTKAVYDSDNAVASGGGIKAWVQSAISSALAWANISNKPFESLGDGLSVVGGLLEADVTEVSLSHFGTASASSVRYQSLDTNGSIGAGPIDGTMYMEQTKTTSTSTDTTYTFTDNAITSNSFIKVGANQWGIVPSDVVTTSGQCVVTIPKQDTAFSLGIRIYIM